MQRADLVCPLHAPADGLFFFAFDDEYDHATDMYSTGLPFVYLLQSRLFGCELFFFLAF